MEDTRRWPRAAVAPALRLLLLLALLGAAACRVTSLPLWRPAGPSGDTCDVEQVRDVAYADGPKGGAFRHRLDLFVPKGKKDYPVVVLVHGGAWVAGDNRCCGLYSSVGQFLASQGVGAVLPNYRLSPRVRHPEHVKDVARAVAWVRSHIAEYGGSPERLFLAGHSAGGHLVSLLASDETYLEAEGLRTNDVKGVIALSGVYRIPPGSVDVTLGGATPRAFRLDEVVPVRGRARAGPNLRAGLPLSVNVYGPAFGNDPLAREDASPLSHVRPGLPPFLIVTAEKDLPTLAGMAEELHEALVREGCEATLLRAEGRNHNSVMFRAVSAEDPVARAMLAFIRRHARPGGS
jgi:acetyl esterase/lipase